MSEILVKQEDGTQVPENQLVGSQIQGLVQYKYGNHIKLTNDELTMLRGYLANYQLSFFSNDIYIINYGGKSPKNQIIVSIEAMRKVAGRQLLSYSLDFEYFSTETKERWDLPFDGCNAILAKLTTKEGQVFKKPVLMKEYFVKKKYEDSKDTMWETKQITMLLKVAEAHILRMACNLGGMYVSEEFQSKEFQSKEPETVYDDKAVPVDQKSFKIEPKNSKVEPQEDTKTDDIPWDNSEENTANTTTNGRLSEIF